MKIFDRAIDLANKMLYAPAKMPVAVSHKQQRNDYCKCKSGLKYKNCCMNKPTGFMAKLKTAYRIVFK